MRTLTLGVLIVSGGTLAALPFRRYQAIPDASSAPLHVTGPTQSALDVSLPDTAEFDGRKFNVLASDESAASDVEMTMVATSLPPAPQHIAPQPVKRHEPRQTEIPLTYRDLEQPIDQPVAIQRRFSATAAVHEQQLEQERIAGLVMPAMESLATSQREELKRVAESFSRGEVETRPAAGRLASTPSREQATELLPETPSIERPRHWIRQPN